MTLHGTTTFLTILRPRPRLARVPGGTERVVVDFTDERLVDHKSLERLQVMSEALEAELVLEHFDRLQGSSEHPRAARWKKRAET